MMRSRRYGYGRRPVSRRGVLLGGVAVLLGAGGGVAAGVVRPLHSRHSGKPAPAELVAALAAEHDLIARINAVSTHDTALRRLLAGLHADHQAHADAITAALQDYPAVAAPASPRVGAQTKALVRAAEQGAATSGARRAAQLDGKAAALLASISACEASHAEALT